MQVVADADQPPSRRGRQLFDACGLAESEFNNEAAVVRKTIVRLHEQATYDVKTGRAPEQRDVRFVSNGPRRENCTAGSSAASSAT